MDRELTRQRENIELIASENIVSPAVMAAMGSVLTNKYAEGLPGKRYYGGCVYVDQAEQLAIDRACQLFGAKYANVQPHSGAQANLAVYFALLNVGDTVLGMDLSQGGHLTHGSPVNMSGKNYRFVSYGVDENGYIDYNEIEKLVRKERPKLVVAGASAYPRAIDFARLAEIAHGYGAYLMVDMAHIAGLVAGGAHQSPVPYADVVTTTTHKTLRGPRGGLILCREITSQGRSSCRVNGTLLPLSQYQLISAQLMDIHGQHEHQSLMDDKKHLGILDATGGEAHRQLMEKVQADFRAWHECRRKLEEMRKASAQAGERMELLRIRQKELKNARLVPGEEEELARERDRFRQRSSGRIRKRGHAYCGTGRRLQVL
jgi:hypothetical protein